MIAARIEIFDDETGVSIGDKMTIYPVVSEYDIRTNKVNFAFSSFVARIPKDSLIRREDANGNN